MPPTLRPDRDSNVSKIAGCDDNGLNDTSSYTRAQRTAYAAGLPWNGTVYYFRWPTRPFLVKIGWSRNVRVRLGQFAWEGQAPKLLAAEPWPDRELENKRHRQFAHLQVIPIDGPDDGRTEVFLRTDEMNDWLARVRDYHRGWPWQASPRGNIRPKAVLV